LRATIVTHHRDAKSARSIANSLKADNDAAPSPLRIRSRVSGKRVISTVTGAEDIESLLGTVDDLLLCMITADRAVGIANARKVSRHASPGKFDSPKV